MKELTIVERDRPGLLADVSSILGSKKVNIDSISAERSPNKTAIIRIVTNAYIKAKRVLRKRGYRVMDTDVLVVRMKDKPGELAAMTRLLAEAEINMESMYMLTRAGKESIFALKTDDREAAKRALRGYL